MCDLRRKSVPELWGLDWLGILYRLERSFDVVFDRTDFAAIPAHRRVFLTAGQLWDLVAAKLGMESRTVPDDGWDKVLAAVSEELNVKPVNVQRESTLYAELDMSREI